MSVAVKIPPDSSVDEILRRVESHYQYLSVGKSHYVYILAQEVRRLRKALAEEQAKDSNDG